MKRRDFLRAGAAAGLALSMPSQRSDRTTLIRSASTPKDDLVRIGIIGVGLRGREHLRLALRRDDTSVVAICDIDQAAIDLSQEMIGASGKVQALEYSGDDLAFREMVQQDNLDAVIIATPWRWHARMAIATMRAGKYAGVEVPAAITIDECWDLVNVSEETGMPCMILENVCYRRDVMAILNMVRQGLFGELVHLECGYQHDLRRVKFNDGMQPYGGGVEFGEKGFSEARWRTQHSVDRNGDLYPTHGIGPVATMIDVNRGNRFISLTSAASKSRGLHQYIVDRAGEDHPNAHVRFKLGDVVTTVIRCANGETIVVRHDTNLPRPYSLGFRVQGVRGIWMDVNDGIYLEGRSPGHDWELAAPYVEEYDHPLWRRYSSLAEGAGHGGMDFFVLNAFIESAKRRSPTPLDVYDAASWSVISALSERSIATEGEPQEFPDFTRGRWINRQPVFALSDTY